MGEDYGDVWVCTDCYFAHHYGARQHDGLWYAGEDDEPVGGQYLIDQGDTSHNLEPLGMLGDDFEVADNTCSDHYYGQGDGDHPCPNCDDGDLNADDPDGPYVECPICEGDGTIREPCAQCGSTDDETGIEEFSWRACDGCHSSLGGARYRLHLWEREGANAS